MAKEVHSPSSVRGGDNVSVGSVDGVREDGETDQRHGGRGIEPSSHLDIDSQLVSHRSEGSSSGGGRSWASGFEAAIEDCPPGRDPCRAASTAATTKDGGQAMRKPQVRLSSAACDGGCGLIQEGPR